MILDIVITKTDDGVNAEVPSIHGCETWAADEETALTNILELARYYLKMNIENKFKLDKARVEGRRTIYKLIFDK